MYIVNHDKQYLVKQSKISLFLTLFYAGKKEILKKQIGSRRRILRNFKHKKREDNILPYCSLLSLISPFSQQVV